MVKQFNFKGIKFSVYKKDYAKIEKQNNISITVLDYENKTPYRIYTSKQTFEKHIDLFLLWNSKSFHYVLIKDFDSLMTTKAKHHGNNHTKSVLISEECVLTLIIQMIITILVQTLKNIIS